MKNKILFLPGELGTFIDHLLQRLLIFTSKRVTLVLLRRNNKVFFSEMNLDEFPGGNSAAGI